MSKISSFTGEICLSDLICENITIPDYQRPYVWDTERVKILLEDLGSHISYKDKNTPKISAWQFDIIRKQQQNRSSRWIAKTCVISVDFARFREKRFFKQ